MPSSNSRPMSSRPMSRQSRPARRTACSLYRPGPRRIEGARPPAALTPEKSEVLKPAVPIKKSVTPDYIISLEDGKKFKSLKRHLSTHYDGRAQLRRSAFCPRENHGSRPQSQGTGEAGACEAGPARRPQPDYAAEGSVAGSIQALSTATGASGRAIHCLAKQ